MNSIVVESGSWNAYSHLPCSTDEARRIVANELGPWEPCRRVCMRTIFQLVGAYQLSDETATHTIVLLDRFLAARIQDHSRIHESDSRIHHETAFESKLCLKGMPECFAGCCFLLATKFREIESPCIRDIARILASSCPEQIRQCENEVLECISWELHATTGSTHSIFLVASISRADLFAFYSLRCRGGASQPLRLRCRWRAPTTRANRLPPAPLPPPPRHAAPLLPRPRCRIHHHLAAHAGGARRRGRSSGADGGRRRAVRGASVRGAAVGDAGGRDGWPVMCSGRRNIGGAMTVIYHSVGPSALLIC
jgi:hypothetical protein